METFREHRDLARFAQELKRRYPHLTAEIESIKQEFALDELALEEALQKLRRLTNMRFAANLMIRAYSPLIFVDTRVRSYTINPLTED